MGIAPGSSWGINRLYIGANSNLFALNGDINIGELWCYYPSINLLNVIDNPNDSTPYSITFGGNELPGYGTINQRSHGDLIFTGTDHFEGNITTQTGYGRVVLNGDTGANIQMKGGEIAGQGETRGDLTARNRAIISPGDKDSVGTLSFGNVDLDPSTILNFKLGSTNNSNLINVNGNLILAGTLNINALSGFELGTYALFNYKGNLTYNGLKLGSLPDRSNRSKFYVHTAYPGKIILLVPDLDSLNYSRSVGGHWDERTEWEPRGVPDHNQAQVKLANNGVDSLNLDLNNKEYTVKKLKVTGNDWALSNGTLLFDSDTGEAGIEYSGSKTLRLAITLKLQGYYTTLDVSDEGGTMSLLGAVSGELLTKKGPGTLLIEAPFDVERLDLRGGTIGVAPGSFNNHTGDVADFFVLANSKLFALGGDINIPGPYIYPDADLNVIDNPNDSPPHSITFYGYKFGEGTINQFSHGDLIFIGTDDFEGTINTQTGYGRVVLNGDTCANIEMDGGEIAGKGGTRGKLTARNAAIISPGNKDEVGTLTFGDVDLDKSTILNFKLGSQVIGESDLIQVNGNLTLAGNLNINALSGFRAGTYTLFSYEGKLTYNKGDLGIGSVSDGKYDLSKFYVQTAYRGKVNLLTPDPEDDPGFPEMPGPVIPKPAPTPTPYPMPGPTPGFPEMPGPVIPKPTPTPTPYPMPGPTPGKDPSKPKPRVPRDPFFTFNFWDGDRTIADGTILGGSGVWNNTSKTWSNVDGFSKKAWNGYRAVFGGDAGIVDVRENISFRNIEFIDDGYTIHSSNNSKLLANGSTTIKVDSTYLAEILAEITGTGSISKIGPGTLTLSHDNSYTGDTILEGGTLVANTRKALSSGSVTLEGGLLGFGNTQTLEIGSYTQNQDATLTLRVNSPTNYDQLVVNGSANLGGTLLIDGKPSNFGKEMLLITTEGLDGRFDNIQFAQTSLKRLSATYDTKNVYVTSHFAPIWPYAKSRNARALACNLDLFLNTGRKEDLFNILADLSLEEELPAALETLVPGQAFTLSSIGLSVSRSLMRSLLGRLEDLISGAGAPKQRGLPSLNFYIHGNGSFGRQRQDNGNEVIGYNYGRGSTFIGATTTSITKSTLVEPLTTPILTQACMATEAL